MLRYNIYIFVLGLKLAMFGGVYASEMNYRYLDTRNGLSSDMVNDICQDHEGFIWAATPNGLNIAMGNTFETYKTDHENYEDVICLEIAKDGKLWLGTRDNGITILDRKTNQQVKINTRSEHYRIRNNKINDILCDSRGNLWIASSVGLNRYDSKEDSMYTYGIDKDRFLNGSNNALLEDSKGTILIASWGGVFAYNYDDNSFKYVKTKQNRPIIGAYSLGEDSKGNLWIGTWGRGLYVLDYNDKFIIQNITTKQLKNNLFDEDITFNIIYDIFVDKQNRVWLGTDVGLGLIEHANQSHIDIKWIPLKYGEEEYLIKDITKVFVDAEESMWIGTVDFGMCVARPDGVPFKTYKIYKGKEKPSTNAFTSFWEVGDKLYAGVQSLGYGIYDIENQTFTSYEDLYARKESLPSSLHINAVSKCEVDSNYLWMMTRYKGLLRHNLNTRESSYPTLTGRTLGYEFFAKNEDFMALSDAWHSILLYEKNHQIKDIDLSYRKHTIIIKETPCTNISSLYFDSENTLWATSLQGGAMYSVKDSSQGYHFEILNIEGADEFNKLKIQTVFEDSKKNMWFGTIGRGLWLYSKLKKEVYNYHAEMSLANLTAFAIEEDDFGNIWASTNKGLICILANSGQTISYTIDDGIQGSTFIQNSCYKAKDGKIYFGGHHGFNVVDAPTIKYNTYIPPLAFTSLMVDNNRVYLDYSSGEELVIHHHQKSFSIEFAALSYRSSSNNNFLYKLEGFNDDWVYSENNIKRVIYGKLPPGKYVFKLKGSNGNGLWNNVPLTLNIVVKKSPYKTTLAYAIYAFLFLLIAYVIYHFWHKDQTLKLSIKEEKEVRVRSEELNQFKLRFFTNISHELLTPLSIISNASEKVNMDKVYNSDLFYIIDRNTKRLLSLINQLLDFRKTETGVKKLKVCEANFEELAESLRENFLSLCEKKKITFSTSGEVSEKMWFDPDFLDKILHNILSNAFKFTPSNGTITFNYGIAKQDGKNMLQLQVSDTGKGIKEDDIEKIFKRFYRSDDKQKIAGTGIGLAFTRSLVDIHKGRIWAQNNEDKGATFYVEIPIDKDSFSNEELSENEEIEVASAEFFEDVAEATQTIGVQQFLSKEHKIVVLVVEDNDDMRSIIKSYLENHFTVYEAENGIKALKLLELSDVDIIVSDVMMPEMDGITLCRKLKGDIKTSHMPIILMTAKNSPKDMIEGYEALADSYLSKPINMDMLNVRINNILRQRNSLKSSSSFDSNSIIEKSGIGNLDKEFLEKINHIIKENIGNNDFRVNQLFVLMGSSESVIFRKVKALTGKSPNQYIREVKLNIAAQMIRKGGKPVEVCYLSGFTDPSYFSSCFKKQFGVSPSKYMKG